MGTEKRRINTQMPRRLKVQTATPMESEWDITADSPPSALRTPAEKMKTGTANHHSPSDTTSTLPRKKTNDPSS